MGFNRNDLPALVQKFAPIVYFHQDEIYLPTSVSWYMSRVQYVETSKTVLQPGEWSFAPSPGVTQVAGVADEYMQIPGDDGVSVNPPPAVMAIRQGSLADAQTYVHVRDVPTASNQVDLQYWLFYAFNGAEYLHAESPYSSADADFPLSFHEGDWECVTVRVDDQNHIVAVRLSEHSWSTWLTEPQSVVGSSGYQVKGSQVVVYAARGSHANYPVAGGPFMIGGFQGGIGFATWEIGLVDYTTQGPNVVDYSQPNRSVIVKNDAPDLFIYQPPPSDRSWVGFLGKWGPTNTLYLTNSVLNDAILTAIKAMPLGTMLSTLLVPPVLDAVAYAILPFIPFGSQDGPVNPPAQKGWSDLSEPVPLPSAKGLSPGGKSTGYWSTAALLPASSLWPGAAWQFFYQPSAASTALSSTAMPSVPIDNWGQVEPVTETSTLGIAAVRLPGINQGSGSMTGVFLTMTSNNRLALFCYVEHVGFTVYPAWWPSPYASSLGALAYAENILICAYAQGGQNGLGSLMVSTAPTVGAWNSPVAVPNAQVWQPTSGAPGPAAAALANRLFVIVYPAPLGGSNDPYGFSSVVSSDSVNWQGSYALPVEQQAGTNPPSPAMSGPALGTDGLTLFCAYIDGAQRLRLMQTSDGQNWSGPIVVSGSTKVMGAPAIAVTSTGIMIVALGTNKQALYWYVSRSASAGAVSQGAVTVSV